MFLWRRTTNEFFNSNGIYHSLSQIEIVSGILRYQHLSDADLVERWEN